MSNDEPNMVARVDEVLFSCKTWRQEIAARRYARLAARRYPEQAYNINRAILHYENQGRATRIAGRVGGKMNEETYKRAMAVLEELLRVINEAADIIESSRGSAE